MTMEAYPWDLEERVEDAFVAYLKANVQRVAMVIPSMSAVEARFPLIVVEARNSDNKNPTAPFTGKRSMDVTITMMIEAINRNGAAGSESFNEDARETYRAIKSNMIGWLSGNDLHTELNAIEMAGVDFSMAHMTRQERSVEEGRLMLMQALEVIAQPKEL